MTKRHSAHRAGELAATDKAHFAAALHEQRRFRVEQLAQLAEEEARGAHPSGSLEVSAALQRAARHALTEIGRALSRLEAGSYGTCVDCGRQIARERLEVLPAAALCMACQHRAGHHRPPAPVGAGSGAGRSG